MLLLTFGRRGQTSLGRHGAALTKINRLIDGVSTLRMLWSAEFFPGQNLELCLANIPTAVKYPRGGADRVQTKMVRLPTTLTTMASRRPRGQSSDTVVRHRNSVQEHQSTLRAYTWVGRTRSHASAARGRCWFEC